MTGAPPWAGIQAELQRLHLLTDDIPTMKTDLELLRADLDALQRIDRGLATGNVTYLEPLVRQVVAQEMHMRQTGASDSQSWAAYFGLGTDSEPRRLEGVQKTPFDSRGDEDSDESTVEHCAAHFGPPGAEPLQHIIHKGEDADATLRLLGLETITFKNSIWDASVIVMLHLCDTARKVVGNFNVVLSFCLLLVNILIQCGLVLAVHSMADKDPVQSWIGVLRSQRLEDQSYERFDRRDLMTRTQQLCSAKIHNQMQTTTLWLSEYLNEGPTLGRLPGGYICLLAMFVWIVSIGIELRRTLHDLALVILALPHTNGTKYDLRDGKYIITGVSALQKVLSLMVVILPRTLIALFLLWFGLIYLAGTLNVDDLIINVLALHFVTSVDELLFEALVPRRMAAMVSNMAIQVYASHHHTLLPSELLRGRVGTSGLLPPESRRGLSVSIQSFYALSRAFYVVALLLGSWYYLLRPVESSARDAYDALCGHDTSFTYMLHPVTNTPIFAHVDMLEPGRHDKEELRCFYAAQYEMVKLRAGFQSDLLAENSTLNAMIAGFHPACKRGPVNGWSSGIFCPEASLSYFERVRFVGENGFYSNHEECRDQDVFFAILQGVCSHPKFTEHFPTGELDFFADTFRCSDLRNECHSSRSHAISLPWFWQLQKTCPETCGMCTPGSVSSGSLGTPSR